MINPHPDTGICQVVRVPGHGPVFSVFRETAAMTRSTVIPEPAALHPERSLLIKFLDCIFVAFADIDFFDVLVMQPASILPDYDYRWIMALIFRKFV
jgi:hypothetical protein